MDEFTFVDETDQHAIPDVTRIGPSQEKWGWIMFECGLENLTIKGKVFFVLYFFFLILSSAEVGAVQSHIAEMYLMLLLVAT